MHLPGLGPKTARRIWQELGVTTLDELKAAAEQERLRSLAGLGAKSEDEDPGGARAGAAGSERVEEAARRRAAGRARRRLRPARAPGGGEGVRGGLRAPPPRDVPRSRHHRDLDGSARAARLLHALNWVAEVLGQGRHEGDRDLERRASLRPARRPAGVVRQSAAALHRLEGPQRRTARGGSASRVLGLRVRRHHRRDGRGRHSGGRGNPVRAPRLRLHPARAA